jgi:hypothetical protein
MRVTALHGPDRYGEVEMCGMAAGFQELMEEPGRTHGKIECIPHCPKAMPRKGLWFRHYGADESPSPVFS